MSEENEKAYDLKELGLMFKDEGLELAEDSLQLVYTTLMDWVEKSAKKSDNVYDDMLVGFRSTLDKLVLTAVDKIDGEDDPER